MFTKIWRTFINKKGELLISLIVISTVFEYAFANMNTHENQGPVIKGTVIYALNVNNVEDLYAWQAIVTYNPKELKVLNITPGGFVGSIYPPSNPGEFRSNSIFVNSTDFEDAILIGGCLIGETKGKDGSGRLAYIVFGYFEESYQEPCLVPKKFGFKTMLLNSASLEIPLEETTLLTLDKVS